MNDEWLTHRHGVLDDKRDLLPHELASEVLARLPRKGLGRLGVLPCVGATAETWRHDARKREHLLRWRSACRASADHNRVPREDLQWCVCACECTIKQRARMQKVSMNSVEIAGIWQLQGCLCSSDLPATAAGVQHSSERNYEREET